MTNDDGYRSPGLRILAEEIRKMARVTIISPEKGVSSCSNALTLRKPLRLKKKKEDKNIIVYSLNGTTGDCCKIALEYILKDDLPDLIVSGMNDGYNTGSDCLYSGTVAGAMESIFVGIPALAVSTEHHKEKIFLQAAAKLTVQIIQKYFIKQHYPGILNMNIPCIEIKKLNDKQIKIVPLGLQPYSNIVKINKKEQTEIEFIMSGEPINGDTKGTDVYWTRKGYITLTPLQWNQTDKENMEMIEQILKQNQ